MFIRVNSGSGRIMKATPGPLSMLSLNILKKTSPDKLRGFYIVYISRNYPAGLGGLSGQ